VADRIKASFSIFKSDQQDPEWVPHPLRFSRVRILNLFVLSTSNHASHQEKSSHLHPNRPSDQLSCRTPRYILVAELSATTHLRAHFEARPQIEFAT
jgi:hypothetical protein